MRAVQIMLPFMRLSKRSIADTEGCLLPSAPFTELVEGLAERFLVEPDNEGAVVAEGDVGEAMPLSAVEDFALIYKTHIK